jgi:hypothetical protein
MDIEFHYWITGILALRAGFTDEEAHTIAYSSQYVDDNDLKYEIKDPGGGKSYRNFVSQTMNILKPKHELMRIYPIFHFVPGDPLSETCYRCDGKMHLLVTTPCSENAVAMLDEALNAGEDTRLYRIGIATHSFVDTWAHQNFVGWYDHYNNIGMDPKPDIGHANAEHHPDWVSHRWQDNRLVDKDISNIHRFLPAAEELYRRYGKYLKTQGRPKGAPWGKVEEELVDIMGATYSGNTKKDEDQRTAKYRKTLGWPDYKETYWFNAAIDTKVHGLKDRHNGLLAEVRLFKDEYTWKRDQDYKETDWYNFQRAVKAQERLGLRLLSPTFRKMGYDLTQV